MLQTDCKSNGTCFSKYANLRLSCANACGHVIWHRHSLQTQKKTEIQGVAVQHIDPVQIVHFAGPE